MDTKIDLNEIVLLSPELLDDTNNKRKVYYWINMFIAEVGWHYPLDLIWQYKKIMDLNLPKGATILDAGAGNGMMQFILAGNGYNIISVDFANRRIPLLQSLIFKISESTGTNIDNTYVEYLTHRYNNLYKRLFHKLFLFLKRNSWFYLLKGFINRKSYGSIKYIKADFSDLSFLPSDSINAIVSTSAIEHNPDHENLRRGISEFYRVLKNDSATFITTSVTDGVCQFDKHTQGYFTT